MTSFRHLVHFNNRRNDPTQKIKHKRDHLRMNVAPDQTIILGLQIFLDHRSSCLAPPCHPPFVHLSSLEVALDQSEACLVHSVRWSGWLRWSSRFILVHQSSPFKIHGEWNGSWTLLEQPGPTRPSKICYICLAMSGHFRGLIDPLDVQVEHKREKNYVPSRWRLCHYNVD